jgi:predicted amidohydrolase YtcJ
MEPAELVVTGGVVLTFTRNQPRATALAVRDGTIVAVGTGRDIEPLIGPATTVLALDGRAVIPGINDAHLHATWLGMMWPHTLFGEPGPAGRLGTSEQRREAIIRAGRICAELGITSYTEAGLGPGEDDGDTGCFGQDVLAEYVALADAGLLSARVTALRLFGRLDGPSTLADLTAGLATPALAARDSRWFAVTGVKIFADGIPPMHTAWTRHSYPDSGHGALLVAGRDDAERAANLHAMITRAMAAGAQVGVHATGDLSIDATLGAFAAGPRRTARPLRTAGPHYIVHGDMISDDALRVMARLGAGLTVQPGIATATRELMAAALGPEVTAAAWPLAAMLGSGVPLTLSSDAPVLAPDWRANIADAALLLARPGTDPALMTRLLRCYTTAAAEQDGAADWKGSIAPGMAADLCVLNQDPRTVPLAEARKLRVETTIADGRIIYPYNDSGACPGPVLREQLAAVHGQADPGDVTGLGGGEEHHGGHDVIDPRDRAERNPRLPGRAGVRVRGEACGHRGEHRTRRHRVDPDPGRGQLDRRGPGQRVDRGFGGLVVPKARGRLPGPDRAHVDDRAPDPVHAHVRAERPCHQERAAQVDPDAPVEHLDRQVGQRAAATGQARVIHQHVDAHPGLVQPGCRGGHRRLVGDVELKVTRPERVRGRPAAGRVQVRDQHLVTPRTERRGDPVADSARTTGDENHAHVLLYARRIKI